MSRKAVVVSPSAPWMQQGRARGQRALSILALFPWDCWTEAPAIPRLGGAAPRANATPLPPRLTFPFLSVAGSPLFKPAKMPYLPANCPG